MNADGATPALSFLRYVRTRRRRNTMCEPFLDRARLSRSLPEASAWAELADWLEAVDAEAAMIAAARRCWHNWQNARVRPRAERRYAPS